MKKALKLNVGVLEIHRELEFKCWSLHTRGARVGLKYKCVGVTQECEKLPQ